jgi:hypothetical protein
MRRPLRAWLFVFAGVAWLAPVTRVARADDPTATDLIERGLDLRQAHRDAEALMLFETAEKLAPSPRGRAQVALAEQALGRWGLAEKHLRAALDAKSDPWIESRRPILERALAVIAAHLGDVEIVGAKGTVFVDGVRIDEPDALVHLRLEAGRRTLELRADGVYPFSRTFDVLPGDVVRIEVVQHALLAETPAVTPPPPASSGASTAQPSAGRTQRTLAWVSLGGAGALVATGVAGLFVRSSAASDFNSTPSCTGQPTSALSSQCKSWLDQGTTGSTVAVVGFVGGGVAAALSIVLFATAPATKARSALSFPCSPVLGAGVRGASCALEGSF